MNRNELHWSHSISAIEAAYYVFHKLGLRGTDEQQQVKQGIAAALLVFKEGSCSIANKKLMDQLLPHDNDHTRNDWIDKCVMRRNYLEVFGPEPYCASGHATYDNPSCVFYTHNPYLLFELCQHIIMRRNSSYYYQNYEGVLDRNECSQSNTN